MTGSGPEGRIAIPERVPSEPSLHGDLGYDAFEAEEVVGRGGNATVYAASLRDDPERVVALKEPHVSGEVTTATIDRFRTEAETWAGLDDHANVVSVHAWGTDPHPWIALEYLEDGHLADRIGECGVNQWAWIGARVAAAIDHAHRDGVAHLDLKPENVLFGDSPGDAWAIPKVADWGMARLLRSETVNLEGLSPRYAAPEQFAPDRNGPPGAATDVYQLGVVLYELLVGTPPFDGPPRVLQDAVLEETPPAPSGRNPSLPPVVDDVLDRALAKAPADRYDSMYAFRRELERVLADRTGYDPADDAGVPAVGVRDGASEPRPESAASAASAETGVTSPYARALALADEGFVQLSERYFARRDPAPPLEAWRRGVALVDARAGRAVERTVVPHDGDARTSLTDLLLDGLRSGADHVVLGPPGSGKSTVCKQVACEWFDRDHGPVFYREGGQSDRFERPDALGRRVSDTDGRALVVVEDAVRPEANAVFEFLDRVADSEDVTILLDAREEEWREAGRESDAFGTDPVTTRREALDPVYVPRPDGREHERFVRAVETATDRPMDVDVEQLRADVREAAASDPDGEETRAGELFYLLHRLTALARDPLAGSDAPTTLTDAVRDVYERLGDLGGGCPDVGVCANVLNAAGIGIHPELLYAVVPDEPLAVDDAIDVLDGRVVFPREADWSDGTTAYPAIHEAWSTEFLAHCLEAEEETTARERFGRALTRVLSLADDPTRREQVTGALDGDAPYLARIAADPGRWADETVEAIYVLGRERPKLAPLFGDGERDSVALPAACPAAVADERPVWLGRMFLAGGYFDRAERAFERLPRDETDRAVERLLGLARVAQERGEYDDAATHARQCLSLVDDADRPVARARARMRLGRIESALGDFEAARTYFRAALDGFEAVDDRRRASWTMDSIGIAAALQSEYDRAREYLERSLEIQRELGNQWGVANTLNNLGEVARHQSEYDRAREYHERSFEISRELGDRRGEASSLNNFGMAAVAQGEFDRAREYYERSLDIKRDLGDRQGEANTLDNLGALARRQGEYDRAREYHERSLEISRELGYRRGEAANFDGLGLVATRRGAYDRAREYHERSLDVRQELGERRGAASSLTNLGVVAGALGEFDRARDYLERGLDVARDVGASREAARSHFRLGEVARRRGEHDRAREYFDRALDAVEAGGDPFETTKVGLARGRLALARGDVDLARERAAEARETFAAMGATHWEARSRRLLGRIAAEAGDADAAREHWRAALEAFEAVGAPRDALATLEELVVTGRERGDDDRAERWCERAGELLAGAPDEVADEHREWVRRECSALDDG